MIILKSDWLNMLAFKISLVNDDAITWKWDSVQKKHLYVTTPWSSLAVTTGHPLWVIITGLKLKVIQKVHSSTGDVQQ